MNVLFLMSDSLTPHLTGFHGDNAARTPHLDQLARNGVVFENAYCNSPLCAPSRASMVTGRYVSEIGAFDNASEFSSEWPTIGHALGAVGYETAIIGKMHFIGHDQNHGFDHRIALETDYTKRYDPRGYNIAYQWQQPSGGNPAGPGWMGPSYVNSSEWDDYRHHYDRDETIHREVLSYLSAKGRDSAPFFCCVSYHAPHNPFWIPNQFRELFRDKDLPLPRVPEGVDTCHGPMDAWLNDFHYQPEVAEEMMKEDNLRWLYETYYGMTYDLDRRIGEVLALLKKNGLDDDTAIVFASDHGDMLGHRGMLQKRCFYERSARIALMGSFPGQWQQGARLNAPVSLIDLFPTFADMAGAPCPDNLPGASLAPSLEKGTEPEERPVFIEYHGEGVHAPCFAVRKDDLKYVYVHGHEERLYNVVEDPDEWTNLIDEKRYAPVISKLKAAVLEQFDPDNIAEKALVSQHNRRFVYECVLKEATE